MIEPLTKVVLDYKAVRRIVDEFLGVDSGTLAIADCAHLSSVVEKVFNLPLVLWSREGHLLTFDYYLFFRSDEDAVEFKLRFLDHLEGE